MYPSQTVSIFSNIDASLNSSYCICIYTLIDDSISPKPSENPLKELEFKNFSLLAHSSLTDFLKDIVIVFYINPFSISIFGIKEIW